MPYKDREDQKNWTKTRTGNYMKWLYAKRKLKFDKAVLYEKTLRTIQEMVTPENMRAEAEEALEWVRKREREVGNRFDHAKDVPYWKD